jgi:hypothetical protein
MLSETVLRKNGMNDADIANARLVDRMSEGAFQLIRSLSDAQLLSMIRTNRSS